MLLALLLCQLVATPVIEPPDAPAVLALRGVGIVTVQAGRVSAILSTGEEVRDLQAGPDGAIWASLWRLGVHRFGDGLAEKVGQESYAQLAVRTRNDVWAITDSHGKVVHFDGKAWTVVRDRGDFSGPYEDNQLRH